MKKIFTLIMTALLGGVASVDLCAQTIKWTETAAKGTLNEKTFGDSFKLTLTDTDSKQEVDSNNAYFGTSAGDAVSFDYRLKTGGKSSAKNAMTLTVPSGGTLKVYVRTGSNSATDRNLVLTQNGTELYNKVVQESDAVKGTIGEEEKSIYPIISVEVKAGDVSVTYPVNGLNFYGFEFVASGSSSSPTAATTWNFAVTSATDKAALEADADWTYDSTNNRYSYAPKVAKDESVELKANGANLEGFVGIKVGRTGGDLAANGIRIDVDKRFQINASNGFIIIPNLAKGDVVKIDFASASSTSEDRTLTLANGTGENLTTSSSEDRKTAVITVSADGDLKITQSKAVNFFSIGINADIPTGVQAVKTAAQRAVRYNLAGQQVDDSYKGVVIQNGKKLIQK